MNMYIVFEDVDNWKIEQSDTWQVAQRNSIFDYTEIMATNNRKFKNKEKMQLLQRYHRTSWAWKNIPMYQKTIKADVLENFSGKFSGICESIFTKYYVFSTY